MVKSTLSQWGSNPYLLSSQGTIITLWPVSDTSVTYTPYTIHAEVRMLS